MPGSRGGNAPGDGESIFTVFSVNMGNRAVPLANAKINGVDIICIVDSGASVNVIPVSCVPGVAWHPTKMRLKSYGGADIPVVGVHQLTISHNNKSVSAEFVGVNVRYEKPLLSMDLSGKLGLLNAPVANIGTCGAGVPQTMFEGLGCLKGVEYHLRVKENAHPRYFPRRRVAPALLPKVREELDRLVQQ